MFKDSLRIHNIIVFVFIVLSIMLIGCNDTFNNTNTSELSEKDSYDGIMVEIIQPSINIDESSFRGFLLVPEDLEYIQDELMTNGANTVVIMHKTGEEYMELGCLDDFQVNEKGNHVKILATGDHEKLKAYALKEEASYLANMRLLCNTFEINIKSYTQGQ